MGAMLRFKQETGKEATEIDNLSVTDMCTYLWCCVKSASKADGLDFNLSLLDFADAITPEDAMEWARSNQQEAGEEEPEGEKKTMGSSTTSAMPLDA
jgi:hypothetical protein